MLITDTRLHTVSFFAEKSISNLDPLYKLMSAAITQDERDTIISLCTDFQQTGA